jgi:hypothetical protein
MVHLEHLKVYATDHESNPFGIQWMLYEEGCNLPEIVRTVPHIAFEVDDLWEALKDKRVIIEPNSPSPGVAVAFIDESGVPIELIQFERKDRPSNLRVSAKSAYSHLVIGMSTRT